MCETISVDILFSLLGIMDEPGPSRLGRKKFRGKFGSNDEEEEEDEQQQEEEGPHISSIECVYGGMGCVLHFSIPENVSHDPIGFLRLNSEYFRNMMITHRETLGNPPPSVKIYPEFTIHISKMNIQGEKEIVPIYIVIPNQIIYHNDDFNELIDEWNQYPINRLEELLSETEGYGF